MVFDLGRAMQKKEEFESARLMDFEFRQRARAARLLARELGIDEGALARATVTSSDADIVDLAATEANRSSDEVSSVYSRCLSLARRQLIKERGNPTPYRLG